MNKAFLISPRPKNKTYTKYKSKVSKEKKIENVLSFIRPTFVTISGVPRKYSKTFTAVVFP